MKTNSPTHRTRITSTSDLTKSQVIIGNLRRERIENALAALSRYARRQKNLEQPDGFFDKQHRFYPSPDENHDVTENIRRPSAQWPLSYYVACLSLKHCEQLDHADHGDVLLIRARLKQESIDNLQDEGCFKSILDRMESWGDHFRLEHNLPHAAREKKRRSRL